MKALAILFFLCLFLPAKGQVTGLVTDKEGKGIADAVVLWEDTLSHFQTPRFTYTNAEGKFLIHPEANRPNRITVSRLGYVSQTIPLAIGETSIAIVMPRDTTFQLEEVTVKARRIPVKVKTDRLVYDMEANPMKDGNTLESLRYIPMLQTKGESVFIIGKDETQVYINGKKSSLSGNALNSYLKSLSASEVKSIEVIHTPNSSFRGEGQFGIINILLKDKKEDGIRGNINIQLWHTRKFKQSGECSFTFHRKRLSLNLAGGGSNLRTRQDNMTENLYKADWTHNTSSEEVDGKDHAAWGIVEAEFRISAKNTIGTKAAYAYTESRQPWKGTTGFYQPQEAIPYQTIKYDNGKSRYTTNINGNINYRHLFNQQSWLDIDADYYYASSKQNIQVRMNNTDDAGNITSPYNHYNQYAPQTGNVWSGKAEYNMKSERIELSTGIDTYYSQIKNNDVYQKGKNGSFVEDPARSYCFHINEWTSALFFHVGKTWKNLSLSLGARLEYTAYKIVQTATSQSMRSNYWKILPELHCQYFTSPDHILTYSLTNRMKRPSFAMLNPYKIYTSATNYTTGNPNLHPVNNFYQTLQYNFLKFFIFQMSYNISIDNIANLQFAEANNLIANKPVNTGRYDELQVAFYVNTSYWAGRANINSGLHYTWGKMKPKSVEGENFGYSDHRFQAFISNNLFLSKDRTWNFDCQLGGYKSSVYNHRRTPASLYFNGQLKKSIRNWSIALYGFVNTYIYNGKITATWQNIYDTDRLHIITLSKNEAYGAGVRFSFRFGNSRIKGIQKRNTSGEEGKSRI